VKPIVIIPAYNPDEKLITLVENLKKTELQIVIINDGSKQECMHIFETLESKFQCKICWHAKNIGKGAALKTGIHYAAQNYPECCGYVTADADGQHTPEDILKIVDSLEKNPDHFILGTRNCLGKNIPFNSMFGNRITSFVFLLITGKRFADTQTGLRGIPRKFTKTCLSVPGNRYEYEMNLLLKMAQTDTSFISVPTNAIYFDSNRLSHFHPVRDSIIIYFDIFKFSLSSLASAITDLLLFTLFVYLLFGTGSAGLLTATVIARLSAGVVNFLVNKQWVFQSNNRTTEEVLKYLTLFCCQMILSWAFVSALSGLPLHVTLIKILVDTALFFISYLIQKKYIFRTKNKEVQAEEDKTEMIIGK
jgi:glycosyltransferase involved in cell wall biosynthesis